ncbi:MAG: hypothetical protein NC548_29795 [Lachnospiraceae bacterium]|nr:hypothetical protein [Lachnospiraceae bacterium]
MSLVQQCLEAFDGYITGYSMNAADAAKYTMESGALMIEMESIAALDEIYAADFALESEMVHAVAEAKQMGIPVEEGLKDFGAKIKQKAGEMWQKIKDFFAKMKERVKAWYENVKRVFRSMFGKATDFVKKYKSDIESVNGNDIAADVKIYKYSNIDGYLSTLSGLQTRLTDKLLKEVEEGVRTADTMREAGKNWAESRRNGDPNQALIGRDLYKDAKSDNETRSLKVSVIREEIEDELKKDFGTPDEKAAKTFAYFRSGAKDESDRAVPSSIDMKLQVKYVLETDKAIKDVENMQKAIDNTYKKIISTVEQWSSKYSNASRISPILTTFTSTASTLQSYMTTRTDGYVSAAKERAGVAFQLCKKAMSYKHKQDKGNN